MTTTNNTEKTLTLSETLINDMWQLQLKHVKEQLEEIEAKLKSKKEKEQ
jgi:hypothetical protein